MKISKITLGTAQLGFEYGIANIKGKPTDDQSYRILQTALDNGITSFDTAPIYGNSEEIIGNFLRNNPFRNLTTLTKISKIQSKNKHPSFNEIKDIVKKSLIASKDRLNIKKISICLLHDPLDMHSFDGFIVKSLKQLKNEGIIEAIGASIYTPNQVKEFLENNELDVIQIPMNLFDTRLIKDGTLTKLKNLGKIIFARSIFLQGLFFMDIDSIPKNMHFAKKPLEKLKTISSNYDIEIKELAFSFVKDIPEVDSMIIGVDSEEQLKNNIKLLDASPLSEEIKQELNNSFFNMSEELINPTLWSSDR